MLIAVQWYHVTSKPLFESLNIERNVKIGFVPLKFRPITFIKEKWGPFGKFTKKHTIERRDLDEMNTIDGSGNIIKPVIEKVEEPLVVPPFLAPKVKEPVVSEEPPPPVSKLNTDITSMVEPVAKSEFVTAILPPISKLNTDILPMIEPVKLNTDISSMIPLFTPEKKPEEALGPVPIKDMSPIEGPLFVPVSPPPAPAAPPVEETPSRWGIARFFGDIISEIFSRLLARARSSFFPNAN